MVKDIRRASMFLVDIYRCLQCYRC